MKIIETSFCIFAITGLLLASCGKRHAAATWDRIDSLTYKPEFGISDSRFSCYARFPTGAYYICPPNNMDGKMQNCKVQMKFTL